MNALVFAALLLSSSARADEGLNACVMNAPGHKIELSELVRNLKKGEPWNGYVKYNGPVFASVKTVSALDEADDCDAVIRVRDAGDPLDLHIRADIFAASTKKLVYRTEDAGVRAPFFADEMDHQLMIDGDAYKAILAQKDKEASSGAKEGGGGLTKADLNAAIEKAVGRGNEGTVEITPVTVKEEAKPAEIHSDVDAPGYEKAAERVHDFALVVGIEEYSEVPRAAFAERDAHAVREHLIALGYPERNIAALIGKRASHAGIKKYLETWLPENVKPDSTVFVYFSGHGAPDVSSEQAYLVPWDGDPQFLDDTAYPVARLYQKLNALKAKRVIAVLDACFSGGGGRSVLPKGARPLVTKATLGDAGQRKVVSLTAAKAGQIAGALDDQGHGLFTYYLLKGLNGEAAGADGRVTLTGLYDFLSPQVEDLARRENREQTPQLSSQADVTLR